MVVEAGSGVSTLVIGYCLKRLGRGKVISLEHDERYVTATNELINFHGLTQFACVIHCPLVKVDIGGETFSWYSMEGVRFERPIDILVVDGPPATGQEFPRYPALPCYPRFWQKTLSYCSMTVDARARAAQISAGPRNSLP